MSRGHEKVLDEIILARPAAGHSLAAPMLTAIGVERQPFDIPVVTDGDGIDFLGDQIFITDFADGLDDLGTALVAIFVAQLNHVLANDIEDISIVGE